MVKNNDFKINFKKSRQLTDLIVVIISRDFIVTHWCHTCRDAQCIHWRLWAGGQKSPWWCQGVPGAEIGSKPQPCAPSSPRQCHSKRESPQITLGEEQHLYWNTNACRSTRSHWRRNSIYIEIRTWIKTSLGNQTKVKQSKFSGITWDEKMGKGKGNTELGERGGSLAWLEKIRQAEEIPEVGARKEQPYLTRKGTNGKGWSSRVERARRKGGKQLKPGKESE